MFGKKKKRTITGILLLAAAVALSGCSGARQSADNYPTKPIELVAPYSAGGGVDLVMRAVAEYLGKEWGQTITVVNKPGGGGAIGAQYALKEAPKDGYTVLAVNNSNTTMLTAGSKNPAVKLEDQIFGAMIAGDALAYAVKADAPWKDFKEFSDWVKQHPEQLTWTSVGAAGFSSFGVAEWLNAIGADFTKTRMVTSKGASDSVPKVAGGHAVLAVHTVGEMYAMAEAGKIRILAVQSPERSPLLPNVPTTAEQGLPDLAVKWWTGISFPKGTPDAVINKWQDALEKMEQDPVFIEQLRKIHLNPAYQNSEQFVKTINEETARSTEIAEKNGIRK
ncbi:tripartite tricarboxylate transporter substrate binding protein [Paenibacillus beijingensis]|uniref:Transporter n=1 Tax=Paenibacillus beijingensis TaxID=1126833 RepID=A0A0D5NG29_9BACL|nr:tripartite tricarboxylate transporter substrate binding protein [Paenibacillus beijingensis]AJY74201.1 transporter [Paenibacillus beijingensis]